MEKANAQTQIIERDLYKLAERFDRHLEIYAQNGKELAALKSSVESLRSVIERQEIREKDNLSSIWSQTKQNTSDISEINVTLGKIMVRVSLIAGTASTVASSIATTAIGILI